MPNTDCLEKLPKPALGEPYLLTPGPLTTAYDVKQEMLKDWGSWDDDFRDMTAQIRTGLLALIGPKADLYDCVPMQGPGSYAVEAMLGSFVPLDGKVLVLANGAYGMRAAATLDYLGRDKVVLDKGDYMPPRGAEVAEMTILPTMPYPRLPFAACLVPAHASVLRCDALLLPQRWMQLHREPPAR